MKRVGITVLAVILLASPTTVSGQSAWRMKEGERVRVDFRQQLSKRSATYVTTGTVVRVTSDSLFLGGGPEFPIDDIIRLDVSKGARRQWGAGAVLGAGGGAVVGALLSLLESSCFCLFSSDCICEARQRGPRLATIFKPMLVGGLVGGAAGAFVKSEQWQSIPLDSGRR